MNGSAVYDGALWEGARPASELASLLTRRDLLLELGAARTHARCVFGVPHHAGPGVDRIAERREEGGRVADENAVLYALAAHAALEARGVASRVVVAVHATDHDPNKDPRSPYCRSLLDGDPELVVECHGSGWATPHPIEVSAGTNEATRVLAFGRRLASALGEEAWVAAQARPGERDGLLLDADGSTLRPSALKFPALRTSSLHGAAARGIPALHVEAMPRFRTFGVHGLTLTQDGRALGHALAHAVEVTLARAATAG